MVLKNVFTNYSRVVFTSFRTENRPDMTSYESYNIMLLSARYSVFSINNIATSAK